jgi:predicted amidohydrolase YtcJ
VSAIFFRGGSIYTMDPQQPWAQCVIVEAGRIAFVGSEAEAVSVTPSGAEVVDLAGGMLLPGFIDAHDHLAMMGVGKLGVDLSGVVGKDAILAKIRDYVQQHPGQKDYRGFGWYPGSFEGVSPRREWLDEITGDVPMIVNSADIHDLWFNTAAMNAAGVSASTPDPEASQYYVRDADGTPTGHAVEAAAVVPVLAGVGTFTVDVFREAQALTLAKAPSYGMTSYFEAGVFMGATSADSEPVYADYVARDLEGKLDVRVAGTYWTRSESEDPQAIADALTDWNARLRSPHVSISHCKMWADGTLFSEGALLLQPSCGAHPSVGRMTFSGAHIAAQVKAVQEAGFDMHIHVDADGSARTVLDAIARVQLEIGRGNSRHTIAHNTLVAPEDLPRYAAMGVLANCTPLWGTDYHGQYRQIYTDLLGSERVEERVFPYGDLVRSGAVVTFGADLPGVDVDEVPPLIQIEAAVTRKRPGFKDDEPFVPRQRISLHDALRAYTTNAAFQLRMETEVGSIEVGKRADLVVLGSNLFLADPSDIHAVPVVLTMMDGRVTFDARS